MVRGVLEENSSLEDGDFRIMEAKNTACYYGLHFGCVNTFNDPNCTNCAERLTDAVNQVLRPAVRDLSYKTPGVGCKAVPNGGHAPIISHTRNDLYKTAQTIGDVNAVSSGATAMSKRVVRRVVGRSVAKVLWIGLLK